MQKTWVWSATSGIFAGKSHEEIRRICHSAGLAGIEGSVGLFSEGSEAELESIGAGYREAGLAIDTFHLPFGPEDDIASFYESTRRRAVDKMRYWMGRAAALGARALIQHPTTTRFSVEVEGLDNYLRSLGRSLEALLRAAEEFDLVIAIENMLPGEQGGRLASRPGHFERFSSEFDTARLGFCLDTGHALVAGGPQGAGAFFEVMAPRLAAFHLADNAGDRDSHLAPGRGLVDWEQLFRQAASLDYGHSMCIETPPFAPGPDYSVEAWKQMVEETEALVERALRSA